MVAEYVIIGAKPTSGTRAKVEDVKHGLVGGIIGVAGTLVSQLYDTRDIVCCTHS